MLVFMCNPFKKVRSESCLQVQTCRSTSCQREQPRPEGADLPACTHYWCAVIPSVALGIPQTEMCNHIKHIIFSPTVVLSEVEGPHK